MESGAACVHEGPAEVSNCIHGHGLRRVPRPLSAQGLRQAELTAQRLEGSIRVNVVPVLPSGGTCAGSS